MIQALLSSIMFGIACAIISVSIIDLMAKEPILNWWFVIGEKIGKDYSTGQEVERWFFRPIWGCSKCFAGQLAMWVFILWHVHTGSAQHGVIWPGALWLDGYSLFCHILAITSAITSAFLISSVIKNQNNE